MKDIPVTVRKTDSTDIIYTVGRMEEARRRLVEKEHEVEKAQRELESLEHNARLSLRDQPALLAELESELAELARRREERIAREARVETLRKQSTTIRH